MIKKILIIIIVASIFTGCISLIKGDNKKDVSILFCGDVMLDWGIKEIVKKEGYNYPLKELKDFLLQFDYRFCNLECPISTIGTPHKNKKYIFLAKPDQIKLLKYGNINGVSLANNHIYDYGEKAMINTMTNLNLNEISFSGAGMTSNSAHIPIIIDINEIHFAIFAYSLITFEDSFATETNPGISRADLNLIKRDICRFKKFSDFIIISLHWGDEYSDYPNIKQIKFAHSIIDIGADIIIGHHSHVYNGIEIYKDKPIFYSLGNFIFGSINEDIRDNIVVAIKFSKKRIEEFSVYPISGNKKTKRQFQYSLLQGNDAKSTLNYLIHISKIFRSNFPEKARVEESHLYYQFNK